MSVGILTLVAPADQGGYLLDPPEWVTFYDPDAHGGRGAVECSADESLALRFPTAKEALAFWRQVSTVRPRRDDGRPNRPLTAITVSFEEVSG